LKVEEVMNLFTLFPIGTTMQDGGKRKRSGTKINIDDVWSHTSLSSKKYKIKGKEKSNQRK